VAFLRLAVSRQSLTRDMMVDWKFDGDLSAGKRVTPLQMESTEARSIAMENYQCKSLFDKRLRHD